MKTKGQEEYFYSHHQGKIDLPLSLDFEYKTYMLNRSRFSEDWKKSIDFELK